MINIKGTKTMKLMFIQAFGTFNIVEYKQFLAKIYKIQLL